MVIITDLHLSSDTCVHSFQVSSSGSIGDRLKETVLVMTTYPE